MGLGDLAALTARAKELSGATPRFEPGDPRTVVRDALQRAVVEEIEAASLLDALADPGPGSTYSTEGFRRIVQLGSELAQLRRRLSLPLTDLIVDIEHQIGLDVEVALAGPRGRANLDAFADVVADFATTGSGRSAPSDADEVGTTHSLQVNDLLAFLDVAAEREEGLEVGEVEHRDDAVQLLTIHAAKGLEWDIVAVPHLTEQVFPAQKNTTWLSDDNYLPPPLRGDRLDLPELVIPPGADQKAIVDAVGVHKAAWKAVQLIEERRLLYVALTRSQQQLYFSGHWWSRGVISARGPSEFLRQLREAAAVPADSWAEKPADGIPNPLNASVLTAQWPVDALGDRRAGVEEGAQLVHVARHFGSSASPAGDTHGWKRDVDALLAERRQADAGRLAAGHPDRQHTGSAGPRSTAVGGSAPAPGAAAAVAVSATGHRLSCVAGASFRGRRATRHR